VTYVTAQARLACPNQLARRFWFQNETFLGADLKMSVSRSSWFTSHDFAIERQTSFNREVIPMRNLTSIIFGAAGLLLTALPVPSFAQDCRALRFVCEHKDELGLQGAGTCRRFDEQCGVHERPVSDPAPNNCRQLRWACEHKDQLGLQGAGTCRRFRDTCG
jgi:hypothetical protein